MCQVTEAAEGLAAVVRLAIDLGPAVLHAETPGAEVVHVVLLQGAMKVEVIHINPERAE